MYLNTKCTNTVIVVVYGVILLICNKIPKQQIKICRGNREQFLLF